MSRDWKDVPVEEFTSPSPHMVSPEALLQDVSELMHTHKIRHVIVGEESKPYGIISDRDIRLFNALSFNKEIRVKEFMTTDPYTVPPDTPIEEVAFYMSSNKIGSAIVVDSDSNQIQGIFTSTDALNALVEILRGDI